MNSDVGDSAARPAATRGGDGVSVVIPDRPGNQADGPASPRRGWPVLVWVAVAAACLAHAAAPADTKDRLRRLVRLPRLSFSVGVSFDPMRGYALQPDRAAGLREIEELRAAMQSNPGDAGRYTRIGQVYYELGDEREARQALGKAIDLYRQQGAEASDDGQLLAGYGTALRALGRFEEAERVLRRAVQLAPQAWKPHSALGRCLAQQALQSVLTHDQAAGSGAALASLVADPTRNRPEPAQAEKARQFAREALEHYDEAVKGAPEEAEPYAGRAVARSVASILQALIDPSAGSQPEPVKLAGALYPKEGLPDLQQAARLSPKDPQAIGTAVVYELITVNLEHGEIPFLGPEGGAAWAALPNSTRQSVRSAVARLEELGQAGEGTRAAAALEVLGMLQCFVLQDPRGAEASLRQATERDPTRDQAWETLVFVLATTKRYPDLLSVCEARLRQRESSRNRLLVVKCHEYLENQDRLIAEAETLQRRYPDDFNANLAFAAALARTATDEGLLTRAIQLVVRAEKVLGKNPSAEQVTNLLYARGLLLALSGQTEPARQSLRQLLEIDRDSAEAREALDILEQSPADPGN